MFTVQREIGVSNDHTLGKLFQDGTELCWTLEPGLTRPEHPAIPSGTYGLTLQPFGEVFSWMAPELEKKAVSDTDKATAASFKQNGIPLLVDVPGRGGVEIHVGNTPFDTEGCTLLGSTYDDEHGMLEGSIKAYFKCYPLLLEYIQSEATPTIQYLDVFSA